MTDMVPKESGFNQSETASGKHARVVLRFPCSSATTRDGEVIQRVHFCHHGGTICHPKSSYVTTKLYGTSIHVDVTIIRSFQTEQFSCFLPSPYAATLNWPRQSIGGGSQSSEMAALLNSLYFALTNSCLPMYPVKCYEYIVKCCSGV